MKESYEEGVASHLGMEPYADEGDLMGVAWQEVQAGQLLSSEIMTFLAADPVVCGKINMRIAASPRGEWCSSTPESKNLSMSGNSKCENLEIPKASDDASERSENATGGTADVNTMGQ